MSQSDVYRDRLATCFLYAIHEESLVTIDGKEMAMLNVDAISDALAIVAAVVFEPMSAAQTPQGMQSVCEDFRRDLLRRMVDMRRNFDATGRRPFDATVIHPQ